MHIKGVELNKDLASFRRFDIVLRILIESRLRRTAPCVHFVPLSEDVFLDLFVVDLLERNHRIGKLAVRHHFQVEVPDSPTVEVDTEDEVASTLVRWQLEGPKCLKTNTTYGV
jgi:hypothetical protein